MPIKSWFMPSSWGGAHLFLALLSLPFCVSFCASAMAQGGDVQYVEVPPFLSPNAERVGAVPLPTPEVDTMNRAPSPQMNPMGGGMSSVGSPGNMGGSASARIPVVSSRRVEPDLKKNMFETTYVPGRMVFLNGININSIKNQELENVNLRIDQNGNIYIESAQYEVTSEEYFHPLLPQEIPKFPKQTAPTMNTTTNTMDPSTPATMQTGALGGGSAMGSSGVSGGGTSGGTGANTTLPPLPAKGEVYSKSTGQQVSPAGGGKN